MPALRKAVLHEAFTEPAWALRVFSMEQPRWLAGGFRLFGERLVRFYCAHADVNAASAAHGRERVLEALDRIEAEIQPSGFLVGDRFTVADLTAAALLFPLVAPPQFPERSLRWPAACVRYRNTLVHRRGFQWAAEILRRFRGPSLAVAPRRRSAAWLVPLLLRGNRAATDAEAA
jgi:glutathione S-transferase